MMDIKQKDKFTLTYRTN